MNTEFTLTQKRALAVVTIISLLFAGYFLRSYFVVYGNIIGGAFVVLWHLVVVTNLDNFLRPILVPRDARLNPALMLLAVFAGIAMFGPWGIVIGPVLMIVIVTTIDVYLAVYKGVELQEPDDQDDKPGWLTRWKAARLGHR
jgi:predicted PurR-regulated permease PerM